MACNPKLSFDSLKIYRHPLYGSSQVYTIEFRVEEPDAVTGRNQTIFRRDFCITERAMVYTDDEVGLLLHKVTKTFMELSRYYKHWLKERQAKNGEHATG